MLQWSAVSPSKGPNPSHRNSNQWRIDAQPRNHRQLTPHSQRCGVFVYLRSSTANLQDLSQNSIDQGIQAWRYPASCTWETLVESLIKDGPRTPLSSWTKRPTIQNAAEFCRQPGHKGLSDAREATMCRSDDCKSVQYLLLKRFKANRA